MDGMDVRERKGDGSDRKVLPGSDGRQGDERDEAREEPDVFGHADKAPVVDGLREDADSHERKERNDCRGNCQEVGH